MDNLPKSKLTKKQSKRVEKKAERGTIRVAIRFDDDCNNGHNSFSITGSYDGSHGCIHEDIIENFPELERYIKWHLTSTDGPMHYLANTMYHAKPVSKHQDQWYFYLEDILIKIVDGKDRRDYVAKYGDYARFEESFNDLAKEPDLKAARSSAVCPNGTIEQLQSETFLKNRLPALMEEFKKDMIELGFTY